MKGITMNTPAAFDPKALEKRVAETVQSMFGALIPDDAFAAMVEREVKAYFELETKFLIETGEAPNSAWSDRRYSTTVYATMTPFRRQVWDAVRKLTSDHLEKLLNADALKATVESTWTPTGAVDGVAQLSDLLGAKLAEIAPKMAETMFKGLFVHAVSQAKAEMRAELNQKLGN